MRTSCSLVTSVLLIMLAVTLGSVLGKLIDIKREVTNVIKRHNSERGNTQLRAADMLEMSWDDDLARQAGEYAEKCIYKYPTTKEYDLGSNLYYELDFVHGAKTVHRLVNRAIRSWTRSKDYFTYSSHCERACAYVQMITAQTDKVGCALSTCDSLDNGGGTRDTFASIFVCFYSPRALLQSSYPFKTGYPCSECPQGSICRSGVCSKLGYETAASYIQDSPYETNRHQIQGDEPVSDVLSETEKYYLTSGHNRQRELHNRDALEWDPYLQRWAEWVVNCNVDYPGPAHAYTNFHRFEQTDHVYRLVYEWSTEADVTSIQLTHGCRTPYDNTRCNHYTNILQPMLTSLACATKSCEGNTRQLVCIYDNRVDRAVGRYTYTSRDNRDNRDNRRYLRKRRSVVSAKV